MYERCSTRFLFNSIQLSSADLFPHLLHSLRVFFFFNPNLEVLTAENKESNLSHSAWRSVQILLLYKEEKWALFWSSGGKSHRQPYICINNGFEQTLADSHDLKKFPQVDKVKICVVKNDSPFWQSSQFFFSFFQTLRKSVEAKKKEKHWTGCTKT